MGCAIARTREDVWLEGAYETGTERSGLDGIRLADLPGLLPAGRVDVASARHRRGHSRRAGALLLLLLDSRCACAVDCRCMACPRRDVCARQSRGIGLLCVCGLPLREGLGAADCVPLPRRASGAGIPVVLAAACTCGSRRWCSAEWWDRWLCSTRNATG
jgi:hypothetical protein